MLQLPLGTILITFCNFPLVNPVLNNNNTSCFIDCLYFVYKPESAQELVKYLEAGARYLRNFHPSIHPYVHPSIHPSKFQSNSESKKFLSFGQEARNSLGRSPVNYRDSDNHWCLQHSKLTVANLELPVNLTCTSLGEHANSTQKQPSWPADLNQEVSCCEATAPITAPPRCLTNCLYARKKKYRL